ncbi:MAG: RNA polymerase subunit sigma [Myxococcales bacterium]|nr:RNA polymerase subunit sigma [Myxococcales bacterium]
MVMYSKGRAEAFEVLLNRHERGIYNFILRSCGNPAKAEDMTQDVFLKVIRSAPKYKQTAKFTTWLYTIARNRCIDHARKHGKVRHVSLDRSLSGDNQDDDRTFLNNLADADADAGNVSVIRKDFRRRLKQALDALPEDQREVFILREVSGLKFREIAEVVGVGENTVKSRMRYALEALRGHMEEFRGYSFDRDEERELGGAP